MAVKIKNSLKPGSNRSFLARDFEGFRQQLIEQAKIFFPDKIKDFAEPSVAGMLVDIAASIGDTMSFYLDHQFRELDPLSAVELGSISTHLRNAGVKVSGASPASVDVTVSVIVPSEVQVVQDEEIFVPKQTCLPFISENTTFKSEAGVFFNLTEDLDFAKKDPRGNLIADYEVFSQDGDSGAPTEFKVKLTALAISGIEKVQTVNIPDTHVPFREISLTGIDVTEIISVKDSDGDTYYEVESLSQDTVFVPVDNISVSDFDEVNKSLEVVYAPKRFVRITNLGDRRTKLRFGSGNASALDDDILPDPSELSLELYGKKSFPKFSIDPNSLVNTQTLGLSPRGTTLSITYRHGGGLNHNVDASTITTIESLNIQFNNSPEPSEALSVRQSVAVTNKSQARGGANPPSVEDLRSLIFSARNAQSRVVTRDDLLARIYTMPSKFGRVFRVGFADNPINPLSLLMYVISRDRNGKLTVSPDALKNNLSTYLNEFRLISDAIDVLDANVINFEITYEVFVDKTVNKQSVIQSINARIADAFQLKYFQIDQPLIIDDVVNIIINSDSVISLTDLKIRPIVGTKDGRSYSGFTFPFEDSTKNGIIRPPSGGIFELKFPENDIKGIAI